jgi:glyoxylase-like metal-dependent hydrolase (beta-lactamase superfamily II)
MKQYLLKAACGCAAALVMANTTVASADSAVLPGSGWLDRQAPGFYRLRLGDFRITVLSDGIAVRDLPTIMSDPAKVRQMFAESHQKLPVELSINCFLIDTGSKKILVDTGAGELFDVAAGQVISNLRMAGYVPEDIDAVLLTHIHGDHSGGLSIGSKPMFPNAFVYVDRRDSSYWLNAERETQAPANRQLSFRQSRQTVGPYIGAGRLRTFDGPTELFNGIRSVSEYGHTPGMSGYMVESRGQRLLLWGDIIHASEAQFSMPTISIDYDVDAHAAVATRAHILADAAAQGYMVGGAHLSFPGIGHVAGTKGIYRWVPIPYTEKP